MIRKIRQNLTDALLRINYSSRSVWYIWFALCHVCCCQKNHIPHILQGYFAGSALHRRHNDHDGISNHQPHGCLLNRLFRRRSKKTSKLRVTGLCAGNSPGPVNSPHKGPVTRKMFPFDDVIMEAIIQLSPYQWGIPAKGVPMNYVNQEEPMRKPRPNKAQQTRVTICIYHRIYVYQVEGLTSSYSMRQPYQQR